MPEVWLIRHGESLSNAGEQTLGPKWTGLTKSGMGQAEDIARAFHRTPSLIVNSIYKRAQETARPTIRRFPWVKQETWEDVHEFTYLSQSHSAYMTLQERQSEVERFWGRGDPTYCDDNNDKSVESFFQFISRASVVRERLRYSNEDFIAVFTHGYFMRAIWWLLPGLPNRIDAESMREFHGLLQTLPLPNGAILPLKLGGKRRVEVGDIMLSHLSMPPCLPAKGEHQPSPVFAGC